MSQNTQIAKPNRPRFERPLSLPSSDKISIVVSDLTSEVKFEVKRSRESLDIDASEQIDQLEELIGELEEEIVKRNSWIEFLLRDSESVLAGFDPESHDLALRDFFDVLDVVRSKFDLSEKSSAKGQAGIEEKDKILAGKEEHIQVVERENGRLLKKIQEYQQQISVILNTEGDGRLKDLLKMIDQKCERIDGLGKRLRELRHFGSLDLGSGSAGLPEVSSDSDLYEKVPF